MTTPTPTPQIEWQPATGYDSLVEFAELPSGVRLEIHRDESADSPFESQDWPKGLHLLTKRDAWVRGDLSIDEFFDLSKSKRERLYYWLPVYRMSHSGDSYRTDPGLFRASDPQGWDWGLTGYVFISKADAKLEWSKSTKKHALAFLESTVQVLDDWVNGEVYGYIVKSASGEEIDSCWGFHGSDRSYVKEEALVAANEL